MKDFADQIIKAIRTMLGASQLRLVEQSYQSASFGNAHVQFSGDGFEIRFICDRGDVFWEIARSAGSQWWPVDMVCEALGRETPGFDLNSNLKSLEGALPELNRLYEGVGYQDFERRLEAIAQHRREAMLKKRG